MSRQLVIFVAFVMAASVAASATVAATGGADSPLVLPLALAVMWAPALAVLVAGRFGDEPVGPLGFERLSLRLVPVAVFTLPLVANVAGFAALYGILNDIPWYGWLTPDAGGLLHPPEGGKWGEEPFPSTGLAGKIVVKALINATIVTVFALGEEIGWRAFFLRRIQKRYGVLRGVVYVSLIWALWHTPYALSGMHDVEGVSRGLLVVIMPLGHLGFGLFLGWLWTRGRSVWLVAIAHGVTNNWAGLGLQFVDADQYAGELLAAVNLTYLVVGLAFLALLKRGLGATDEGSDVGAS